LTLHTCKLKFRNYSKDQAEAIVKEFNKISLSVGINEPLSFEVAEALTRFCMIEFKDFSLSEIFEAVSKYNAGKLDFKNGAYQNLSHKFIGDILTAYRSYRNKALAKYKMELESIKETVEPTEEEKTAIEKDYLQKVLFNKYNEAIEKGLFLTIEDEIAFDLFLRLYKNGSITLTSDDLSHFKQKAIQILSTPQKAVLNKQDLKNINLLIKKLGLVERGNTEDKETVLKVREKASALFFNEWINKQVVLKTNIEELF
tara:strand:- start:49 stop:819 length:771 start_codon:yes stop_codon:yes gene_type:complete